MRVFAKAQREERVDANRIQRKTWLESFWNRKWISHKASEARHANEDEGERRGRSKVRVLKACRKSWKFSLG